MAIIKRKEKRRKKEEKSKERTTKKRIRIKKKKEKKKKNRIKLINMPLKVLFIFSIIIPLEKGTPHANFVVIATPSSLVEVNNN